MTPRQDQQPRRLGWASVAVACLALTWALYVRHIQVPQFIESTAPAVAGAYHLHTERSHDSRVPTAAYIEAAHRLGLEFIVLTDHNSANEAAQNPNNLWILTSAEWSTPFGHVVALSAGALTTTGNHSDTEPLATIEAAGGAAIIAHPTDTQRPWTGPYAHSTGLEIANLAASARRQTGFWFVGLAQALMAWPFNETAALVQVYDRDVQALALWDAQPSPAFVGLCAVDAHGWIAPRKNLLGWQLVLAAGTADSSQTLVDAIQAGHFFCSAAILGNKPNLQFGMQKGGHWTAHAGDSTAADETTELVATAPMLTVGARQIVVLRNGVAVAWSLDTTLRYPHPPPGTYRVEVWVPLPRLTGGVRWVPGLYSNKLRVLAP